MSSIIRRLLPLSTALLLIVITAPAASAATAPFPNQSLGNQGADVRAIQGLLLAHDVPSATDGVFGKSTRAAVKAFQADEGLTEDGVVGEATWARLIVRLGPGSSGEAVKALQRQLNQKRRAGLAVNGVYGTTTRTAVIEFRRHMGMKARGKVGPVTWRKLIGHYEYTAFGGRTGLCDYTVGNPRANWGTGAAVGQLEAAARLFAARGRGRVPVGDIGFEHGGNIPGHATHEVGLDVDIRPVRDRGDQCTWGTNWRYSTYSRAATRNLIRDIRAAAPGHVKLIYFNDPVLIREGLTTWYPGHDDHLHIRYCERSYSLARYRC